jgi:UDP-N-acetylmuramoylalanine--D-glutamate ligase
MKALVVGGGVSGISAASVLRDRGWRVILSDTKPPSTFDKEILDDHEIQYTTAPQDRNLLNGIALVVSSPGLSPTLPIFKAAQSDGIPVASEIDLFRNSFPGCVIGITGTNGKSTTTALTTHILQHLGYRAISAGNIGVSASSVAQACSPETVVCLELSSYQLEWSQPLVPSVAILTGLAEDHLARHGTVENYVRCKLRMFDGLMDSSRIIITRQAVDFLSQLKMKIRGGFTLADERVFEAIKLWGLQAPHDRINAACAIHAAALVTGLPIKTVSEHVASFGGLNHRCEIVPNRLSKLFINDSKATNLQSTEAALESVNSPCTLMLGGAGKGEDFGPLSKYSKKIAQIICFGKDGEKIADQCRDFASPLTFATLASALDYLFAKPEHILGDLLFSPGCASFDEFKNFEHRGEYFKDRSTKAFGKL